MSLFIFVQKTALFIRFFDVFQHKNVCPLVPCHLRHDNFDATPVQSRKNYHIRVESQLRYRHICILKTTPKPFLLRFTRDIRHFRAGIR